MAELFHVYADRPVVAKNSAPHSGAVAWVRGLMERIDEPWRKLSSMEKVMAMDMARDVQRSYETLMEQMNEYQKQQVRDGVGMFWLAWGSWNGRAGGRVHEAAA